MSVNVYKNVLSEISVIIPNGETTSPFINAGQLPNGAGAAMLLGIRFPAIFPAANVSILSTFDDDLTVYAKYFCNGTQTNQILIQTIGDGTSTMDVSLIPYFLSPNTQIQIRSDQPMTADTIIYLNFQPVIQGAA